HRIRDRNLVNVAPLQLCKEIARVHLTYLLGSNMLTSREQLLEAGIVADRLPDGIDSQSRNGNALASRHGKKPAQNPDSLGGCTGVGFDFCQACKISSAKQSIFLGRQKIDKLPRHF